MGELSDAEVFGSPTPSAEMSDADVFGASPTPSSTIGKPPADNLGNAPEEIATRRALAQKNMEQQAVAANEAKPWYQKAAEGVPRGMEQGMVGLTQLLEGDKMGAGDKEDLQQVAKNLELQGKGSGISGTAGELAGQMTSPINAASLLAPESVLGRIAGGAMMGSTQPTTSEGNTAGENAAVGAAINTIVPPVISGAMKGTGNVVQGIANKTGATNVISNIASSLGANPTTSKLYQAAKAIGLDIKGKSPTDIRDNLQAAFTKSTGDIKDIISGNQELNPVAANTAISHQYDQELDQSKQLYGKVKELGEGKVTDAGDLIQNTDALINELENKKTLTPEEEYGLNELKYWQRKIHVASAAQPTENGNVVSLYSTPKTPNKIAFNDVVDLKQALNQNFNPSKFPSRKDASFARLTGNVNDILDTISKQTDETLKSPESDFSTALKAANDHWTDVSRTYKNDLIDQFWTPSDYHESKALTDRGIPLSTTLRKRARGMVNNIKTPEDLETLTSALPPQAANAVQGAKFAQIMEQAGIDPKTIYENKDTLDRIFRNNPEASKMLDNITTVMDGLDQKGLGNNMGQQVNRESQKTGDEALRSMWSLATNHKLYALKHAINTIAPGEKTTGKALQSFQKEIKAGAPLKQTISNAASTTSVPIKKLGAIAAQEQLED